MGGPEAAGQAREPWDYSTTPQYGTIPPERDSPRPEPPRRLKAQDFTPSKHIDTDDVNVAAQVSASGHSGGSRSQGGREISEAERRAHRDVKAIRARATQMHWRSRHVTRPLPAAERREIQSRLYRVDKPAAPRSSTNHHKSPSAAVATARASTAAQRAASLALSPSAIAAAKVKARAKAEAALWAHGAATTPPQPWLVP